MSDVTPLADELARHERDWPKSSRSFYREQRGAMMAAERELRALQREVQGLREDRMGLTRVWLVTPNPMLGNNSPLHMMKMGLGGKLAHFIETCFEESLSPKPSGGEG